MSASFLLACVGGVFFFGTTAQFASATTSSSEAPTPSPSSSFCDIESEKCYTESDCLACITGWGADYSSSSECQVVRYPVSASGTTCESLGSEHCCNLGDEKTTDACMANPLFVGYWSCFMNGMHCSIEDLPCYPQQATTAPVTSAPTIPSTLDSSTERDINITSSPVAITAGDDDSETPAAVAICVDEAETCQEYAACEECYSDASDAGDSAEYTFCQLSYLELDDADLPTATSSQPGVCDIVGAQYCCVNDFATGDCLANEASIGYWACVFDFYGCAIDELPCRDEEEAGSFRGDDDTSDGDGAAENASETDENGAVRLSAQSGTAFIVYAWTLLAGLVVGGIGVTQ